MQIPGHIDPVVTPRAITQRADGRIDLLGLNHLQIRQLFEESQLDEKAAKLRSKQVFHWIYHRGVTDFEAMTDIAKTMRPWLADRFVIGRPEVVEAQVSTDGTRKWLLRTDDAQDYEMVFIPDADRGTLCISSQVGCTLNCRFCHTGTMRLVRNLTPGEIVGQVMLARDALGEWPKGNMASVADDDEDDDVGHYTADGRMLTNIVLMGMGEPLYNFDNVRDAMKIVMHGDGLGLSRRRITLSTSGVVPMMARAGEEMQIAARPLLVEELLLSDRPSADQAVLEMTCGKGGYVRSIARDLGEVLGCYGHVAQLRRLWSGPFDLEHAVSLEQIEPFAKTSEIDQFLRPLEEGLTDLLQGTTNAEGAAKLRNGNPAICFTTAEYGDEIWVSYEGKAQAIGRYKSGEIHPTRVILQE